MLINAYDNTIRYTDFLLDSLINTLRTMTDWHSAMIFISDPRVLYTFSKIKCTKNDLRAIRVEE